MESKELNPSAKKTKMSFWEPCWICDVGCPAADMEEREGVFYCQKCAALPPYSPSLFNAIVAVQRLFRERLEQQKRVCTRCNDRTHRWEIKDDYLLCIYCVDQVEDEEQEKENECDYCSMNPCRCDDTGPCEDCGNPWECVCLEQAIDASLKRHRKLCGDLHCDGTCGVQSCGVCIDFCKCDPWD